MLNVLKTMAERQAQSLHYTIVAVGDSVTDGVFRPGVKDFESVYHARLKKKLNYVFPTLRINMIDSGIDGISTTATPDRLQRDVFNYSPDLVIICLGLNDICGNLDAFKETLRESIRQIKAHGIEVIYMTPNMVIANYDENELMRVWNSDRFFEVSKLLSNLQQGDYIDRMFYDARTVAESEGAVVCDCYSAWRNLYNSGVDTTKLLCNRINHPSEEMHELFASMLFCTILNK